MTSYTKTMMESLAEVRGIQEDNMDLMRKAATQRAMQILKMKDGKLKMDSFTASAIMQIYDKLNPANQKKMEKMINQGTRGGMVKLQSFAMRQVKSGYGEETELDEAKNYTIKNGKIHISKANFAKVSKDYKNTTKGKERMMALDPKSGATTSFEVVFEEAELDEGREKSGRQLFDPKKEVMVVKKNKVVVIDKKDQDKYLKQGWILAEETELNELAKFWPKGGFRSNPTVGFDIYHKDFSTAMQHAYAHAKKKGYTVDPEEIADKVASGPRKPSSNRTNTYILGTDKKQNLHIQVYNMTHNPSPSNPNKPYELNMYIEEVENEAYKLGTDEYREYLEKLTPGEQKEVNDPNDPKTFDPNQPIEIKASARSDAMRAMRRNKKEVDPADVDTDASPEDVKGASKNIIMQMRKVISMRGNFDVEFLDKKKKKVPVKIAQAVQDKYNSFRKPADKEKFQAQVAKSYNDMLRVLKAGYKEEVVVGGSSRRRPRPRPKPKPQKILSMYQRPSNEEVEIDEGYLELTFKSKQDAEKAYNKINNEIWASGNPPYDDMAQEGNEIQIDTDGNLNRRNQMLKDLKSGGIRNFKVTANESKEEVEIDEKFTKKDFDKNEDRNLHSENAVELARKFGSKKEYDRMVAIYKSHMKRGSISSSEQKERDALISKYLPKLESVMRRKTILERIDRKLKERKNG